MSDWRIVDLFCGVGGLSYGLKAAGLEVAAGVDIDEYCRYPYEKNVGAKFVKRDVFQLTVKELNSLFEGATRKILVGCAPCQPFSTYNQKNSDPKWRLLDKFGDLIGEVLPDVVSMENVPQLTKFKQGAVFDRFVEKLEAAGYDVSWGLIDASRIGLPQKRSRLVLLASRIAKILLPEEFAGQTVLSVRDAIEDLPPVEAGGSCPSDALHSASSLSPLNLKRVRASSPGGSWSEWSPELRADCHRADSGKGYKSVYGRMEWDKPSPTITTQFFGFGNGRFGHPEQDRAITLREGAVLQGFPKDYVFLPENGRLLRKGIGRLIGNAVPPPLGQFIGEVILSHVSEYNG